MNEFLRNLEFISYRPIKDDPFGMLGLATFRAYGKFLLVFKHLTTKDKSGTFFCSANYSIMDAGGEKKYVGAITLDSRGDDQLFQDWIRENVNAVIASRSARQPQPSLHPTNHTQIRQEASIHDQLPF